MPTQKCHDRGWALLSTGAALIVLVYITTWGSSLIQDWNARQNWLRNATQASRFTQAVKSYTGRYYDTLLSTAPVTVTPSMLKNTGFLEQGFNENNDYGQQYLANVVRNPSQNNQLQALVYTQNGSPLPFMAMDQIAVSINSGMGGYINTAGTVTGARGGWSASLQTFNANTTPGHIAALLTTDDLGASRAESDRLYRFAVNGKPDLNTMHTSIDMGGNDLNNTGNVNAANGNFSSNVTANGTVTGQDVNARGNMSAGSNITANGDIRSNSGWLITRDGKGWLDESHGGGFYMSDNDWVRAVNNKNIYTGGQIRGNYLSSEANINVGGQLELNQVNSPGAWCPRNGNVSRDWSGAPLSCQNNVWVGVKSNGQYADLGYITGQYNGYNGQPYTITVYATGGASTVHRQIGDGDCSNTYDLVGYAGGKFVAQAHDNNTGWAKAGFISFQVPANTSYSIVSSPLPEYGCSPGAFNGFIYQ
ncbi:shufflon system plasmid conjugative transfer pilus tip adhesin PilV [Pantoea stewartii]|uniref:shufflon system plasmid conjugative transfer pilus tip adhesin PilV n=1 Tax=Pantoea stewartii TaxID=66269 RepID=UPI002DB89BCA|nr:shufflon system plasmid conjugative transfer pilus tip adhesin PilV [Pantoea stewartii]MEB6537292.1 shufflon system plasmid conjugative transfer pilus tip adhesin PilV [Pantoea stewartii]